MNNLFLNVEFLLYLNDEKYDITFIVIVAFIYFLAFISKKEEFKAQ